jgi:hypothetical protein
MKSLTWIVVFALAGAAQAQPTAKIAEEVPAADVTRWLGFFDKLVHAVEINAQACDKMASDVGAVIDSNQASIALARDAREKGKKLPRSAQEHMLDGVRRMGPGIEHCAENEKVKAAFGKLDLAGRH